MPPKKPADKPSKKNVEKKKDKVIEDKTFGLKNKKGTKNQKFIAQVEKQVKSGGDPLTRKRDEERALEKKRKENAQKEEDEKKALFRPVMSQKVENGVDPKSVFCAFFKQGLCKKGDKCKFSHDPDIERKSAKRSIYTDIGKEEENDDNMDDWDEEKLAEVIGQKHANEKKLDTAIICKHFLDAVESTKYGWFWSCPNGGKECKYLHALPKGFVLKKDKKKEDKKDETSIEELIEQKRTDLSAQSILSKKTLTPVNLQTFVAWKKRKLREKADKERKEIADKKKKMKSGLNVGMSGRDMFLFDPTMNSNEDDDEEGGEAYDMSKFSNEDDDEEAPVKVHEIKFDEYGIMDDGLDLSTKEQLKTLQGAGAEAGETAIDEDLIEDEDLDELEEELNNLDV